MENILPAAPPLPDTYTEVLERESSFRHVVHRREVVSLTIGGAAHLRRFLLPEIRLYNIQGLLVYSLILMLLQLFNFVQSTALLNHLAKTIHLIDLLCSLKE